MFILKFFCQKKPTIEYTVDIRNDTCFVGYLIVKTKVKLEEIC